MIGDVVIGADSSVWPLVTIRGDMHRIRIGARTSVQDGSVLHITHAGPFNPDGFALTIGDDVTIGHKALLHGCTVGSRILIGMGTIVMDGAVIEDEVILGAGSLSLPARCSRAGISMSAARRKRRGRSRRRSLASSVIRRPITSS